MASMIFDYKNAFRSFNRNVKLMLAYYVANSVGNGMVMVLMNLYFLKLGLDESFLGSTVFVQSLGMGLLVLPFGLLADRVPKHNMIRAAFFLMNLPFTGFMFTTNPVVLLTLFGIQSIGIAVTIASEYPYLAENVPPEARAHLFSINMAIFTAGPALGAAVGGYLPRLLGNLAGADPESAAAYRLAMMVTVAMFWLAGFVALRLSKSATVEAPKDRKLAFKFSRPRAVLGLALNCGFVALAASMFNPFMNVIMNRRFQMPAHVIGLVFTAQNLAISLGALAVPRLAEKRGNLAAATMLQALALPAYVTLALAPNASVFVVGYILRGVIANMAGPAVDTYSMEAVTANERGTVSATLNLARNVLWAVGGKIGGSLLKLKMYSLPIVIACGVYALGVCAFAVMLRFPNLRNVAQDCPVEAVEGETAI